MNASTFASMVVASTLSDIYFAVGSGIEALNGPLHGGANEKVMEMLNEISGVSEVKSFVANKKSKNEKIMGFGHRVYKAYDPRARVLAPLAKLLTESSPEMHKKYEIAEAIEKEALHAFGTEKKTFPNVDFYSGIVYEAMSIPKEMFTPLFAVSRVSGWTARVMEYLKNNRIFRPRAMYVGEFNKEYVPMSKR
jgi:citrate synthase